MLKMNPKLAVAIALAGGGMYLAWRALERATPSRALLPPQAVTATVKELHSTPLEVHPTAETFPRVVDQARAKIQEEILSKRASAVVPPARSSDLVAAFTELFGATVGGEYQRYVSFVMSRGYKGPVADEKAWAAQSSTIVMAPLSLEGLEVRALYRNGEEVSSDQGSGLTVMTGYPNPPDLFPVPKDMESVRGDVVEIRFPMQKTTIVRDEKRSTILVGFQFYWNPQRSQWIPWKTAVYHDPGEIHQAVPFF